MCDGCAWPMASRSRSSTRCWHRAASRPCWLPTLSSGSLHEALIGAGMVPSWGKSSIRAEAASPEDAVLLGVTNGEPMLVERRLIYDQRGRPIERTELRYAADRYGLNVGFSVEDSGAVTLGSRCLTSQTLEGVTMEPRERVLAALDHKEADRVPRDLAGTRYSSIHAEAYQRLRPALGLPEAEIRIVDTTQGLAHVHDDVLDQLRRGRGAGVTPARPRRLPARGHRRRRVRALPRRVRRAAGATAATGSTTSPPPRRSRATSASPTSTPTPGRIRPTPPASRA